MLETAATSTAVHDRDSAVARRGVIAVVVEQHYLATAEGIFAHRGLGHSYAYWRDFFEVFDEVRVIARVAEASQHDSAGWTRADGPGVTFVPVRDHAGLAAVARMLPHTLATMTRALRGCDYVFVRGGGPMSTLAWLCLRAKNAAFARQVVGHDGEAVEFALRHRPPLMRQAVARTAEWLARRQIADAACVAYVAPALQASYPARAEAPVFHYSDVHLTAEVVTGPRPPSSFSAAPLRLISVGRLNPEKGHEILLEALARLDARGQGEFTLELVGPGTEGERLGRRAAELGLGERVRVVGELPWGPRLFAALDAADLFVLPSLTEGLPRALLEAMSRGLPAVGTRVGGVPDLLEDAALAPPGNATALADCMQGFLGNRERLAQASARGFQVAVRWHPDAMHAQKLAFLRALQQRSDARKRRG